MKKTAIYARVSSREQVEGMSIQAQLKQLKKYASENNYEIVNEYVDKGKSARTDDRPEFQKMIAAAKENKFDTILFHKTDRFARNREDAIIYKSLLRKECNIDVISITENFDDSPTGKLLEGVMEVVAEFYSNNLSLEVLKGMNEKAKEEKVLGELPLGYTVDKETDELIIYEPEAKIIRFIFERYVKGDSLFEIGNKIRKNGVRLFGEASLIKKSKTTDLNKNYKETQLVWGRNTISRILKKEIYTGVYKWNKERIENNHQAIIPQSLFNVTQKIIKKKSFNRSASPDYLLKGLLFCYECEGGISQFNQKIKKDDGSIKTYHYLRCSNHIRLRNCYYNTHKMKEVENELLNYLSDKDTINEIITSTNKKNYKKEIEKLSGRLKTFDEQFDRQFKAYQEGIIELDSLQNYKKNLQDEKEKVMQKIKDYQYKKVKDISKKDVEGINNLVSILKDNKKPVDKKREILIKYIDKIYLSQKKGLMKVVINDL